MIIRRIISRSGPNWAGVNVRRWQWPSRQTPQWATVGSQQDTPSLQERWGPGNPEGPARYLQLHQTFLMEPAVWQWQCWHLVASGVTVTICMLEGSSYPRFLPVCVLTEGDGSVGRLVWLELSSRPGTDDITRLPTSSSSTTNMIVKHSLLSSWLLVTAVSAQYDYVSECPAENGFFADALQCDRYYECQDGEVRVF